MVEKWPGAAPVDVAVWDRHDHLHDDPGGARGTRLLEAMDRLGIQRMFVSRPVVARAARDGIPTLPSLVGGAHRAGRSV